jgi:two-component system sensor histidine kinase AtoS
LPSNASTVSRFSSLFKPDPYRDFFRVLADSLSDSIIVISGDGRRILASNHAFTLLSGFSRSELEEFQFTNLLAADDSEITLGQILLAWDNPDSILEDIPLRTRQGSIELIDITLHPIGPLGSAILLKCSPSQKRKYVQAREEAKEQQLKTILSLSTLLISEQNDPLNEILEISKPIISATTMGLYQVSAFHPDYERVGPLPPEFPETLPTSAIKPLLPITIWSLGHRTEHELQKAAKSAGLAALRTAPLGSAEAWIGVLVAGWRDPNEMPEEAEDWMQFIANLCHSLILQHTQKDRLDDLKNYSHQLQSEMKSQFSAVADALLVLDEDLEILRSNLAAADLFGYQSNELDGLPVQDVLVGAKDINGIFLDALGHQCETELSRITIHHRNGTPFPVYMRVVPFSQGSTTRLLVVLQDRSEQQAIEDQTEMLAQRALLGDVTAILAHEVRNPINNISTGVQLVASRLGQDHAQYESLQRLRQECDRLNQLLSDVLFFARPLELKMEPIPLDQMIERILHRWAPRFRQSNVKCLTDFSPDTPRASVDPRTFEQVILNLISNGLQAMPDGGTISVKLEPISTIHGPMIELTIADTGSGIPEEMIDRIFDPFFTTKKEGTGLGLAISRRILAAHKGTIAVESFPDAGTVFTIRIPAVEPSP